MADVGSITPTVEYSDLKRDPQHFVEVIAEIKGIEKKTFGKGASNAEVNLDLTEKSFVLTVDMNPLKGSGDTKKYRYEVKKLPAEIDLKKSYYEVKKGKVLIYLSKVVPSPWARQLASIGLEHDDAEVS